MRLFQIKNRRKPLYCSFCGKQREEVEWMIAGSEVLICNECVDLCQTIGDRHGAPTLREVLLELLPLVEVLTDVGTSGDGWKSDALKAALDNARKALADSRESAD